MGSVDSNIIPRCCMGGHWLVIGLYRKNAIAIESEEKDPFGEYVYYVTISLTMQITLHIPEFASKERNLHCDITTKLVFRLTLDNAIAAIQTSR